MSILIYLVVAVVTVFSVLFEMNIMVEPPRNGSPLVAAVSQQKLQSAPAAKAAASPADATGEAAPDLPVASALPQVISNKCDVAACAATYSSFNASDCTYQPAEGPRRICDKGVPSDPATAEAVLNAHADASAANASPAQCNVSACEQAYVSFTRADCSYQPLEGPRRLCTK